MLTVINSEKQCVCTGWKPSEGRLDIHDLLTSRWFLRKALTVFITLRASESAAQCILIGPVCLFVGVCDCGLVTTMTRIACTDPHQTGFVGKGSDHLQRIKCWPSRAPGKGVCGGTKFWPRLTTASAQCLRLLRALYSFHTAVAWYSLFVLKVPLNTN